MKKKILIALGGVLIIVAALIVVFVLRGRGEEQPQEEVPKELPVVPAPISYELGELDSVVALPVGDSIIVTEDRPEKEEEEEGDGEEEDADQSADASAADESGDTSAADESGASSSADQTEETQEEDTTPAVEVEVTYHYDGLADQQQARLSLYCGLLTAEDFGFTPVDEAIMETELPPIEGWSGSVHLVRPILPKESEEGEEAETTEEFEASLLSLQISWRGQKCSVVVGRIMGGIVEPPSPPTRPPMTLTSAVDYFYSCEPAQLGLTGESMEDYQVIALDGAVLVGTTPCLRMNVYATDEKTGTNVIAGQYLLSNDGYTLFFIDTEGNVKQLEQ